MGLFSAQPSFLNIMYFTVQLEVICGIGQKDFMFVTAEYTEILKYAFIYIRLHAAYHVNKVRPFNMSCLHLLQAVVWLVMLR